MAVRFSHFPGGLTKKVNTTQISSMDIADKTKELWEQIAKADISPTIRREHESFEAFKKRRKQRALIIKTKLRPKKFYQGPGPYVRDKRDQV